ncbi:hypothetical protein EMIT0P294_30622 [Pseudomonas sp. IT-P294]
MFGCHPAAPCRQGAAVMLSVSLAARPPESSLYPLPQLASHRVAVQLRVLSMGSPASSRAGMEIEICVSRCARFRGSIREDS